MQVDLEKFGKAHPNKALELGILIVAFMGFTDYVLGSELSFSIFYLIPITLVTVMTGRTKGVMISFLYTTIQIAGDLEHRRHYLYRIAIFH